MADKTKPKKPKTVRTRDELNSIHRKNIAHDVERLQHWAKDLAKRMSSKKYPLTQADVDKVMLALQSAFKDVEAVAKPIEAQAEPAFSLD